MKNRGFTLTELIAVIIILGVIASVAIGSITAVINKSRERAREAVVNEVEQVARKIVTENIRDYSEDGRNYCIELSKIRESHHLSSSDLIDPVTNEELVGIVLVKNESGSYEFTFNEDENCPY